MQPTSLADVLEHPASPAVLSTLVLLVAVLVGRSLAIRRIRSEAGLSSEFRLRGIAQVRTVALGILAVGLILIWGPALRTLALSMVAVAAAFVIATKELIMCVSGSILRGGADAFSIGDRIEVAGHRGDVIDQNFLATKILEIGPGLESHQYSGRTVVIPNSLFLTQAVVNETFTDEYVLHVFRVPMKTSDDWRRAERILKSAALAECGPFLGEARRNMERVAHEHGLEALSVDPRITVLFPEAGEVHLIARVAVPARKKGRIEQAILRRLADASIPGLTEPHPEPAGGDTEAAPYP